MRRVGERGSGEWERITWDEAMAAIKEKWDGYIAEFGPQCICVSGSGSKGTGYINSYSINRLTNVTGWTSTASCNDMAMAKGINKVFGPSYNTWGFPYMEFRTGMPSRPWVPSLV